MLINPRKDNENLAEGGVGSKRTGTSESKGGRKMGSKTDGAYLLGGKR